MLESFDHAGSEVDGYWQRKGLPLGWSSLQFTSEAEEALDTLSGLRKKLPALKPRLPRSAMVRTLAHFANGMAFDAEGKPAYLLKRSYKAVEESLAEGGWEDFLKIWKTLHPDKTGWPETPATTDAAVWTILLELWDYLIPPETDAAANAEPTQGGEHEAA